MGDWTYKYATPLVRPDELPPLPVEFCGQSIKTRNKIVNVVKYINEIKAIAGEGGHNATFRAACKLRDAGLSEAEALASLVEWNSTNCDPPWTTKELLHKVRSAYERT